MYQKLYVHYVIKQKNLFYQQYSIKISFRTTNKPHYLFQFQKMYIYYNIDIIIQIHFQNCAIFPCKMGCSADQKTVETNSTLNAVVGDVSKDKYCQAAERIYKAINGKGTDEAELIAVASTFNDEERVKIGDAFNKIYSKSVLEALKKDLSGDFENLMIELFSGERYTKWAEYIHTCIKGAGTDEKRLLPLVFLMTDDEQPKIAAEFKRLYKTDMIEMIEGDIGNGDWDKLVKGWLKAKNDGAANAEGLADEIFEAAKGAGTDEETFMIVLCKCNSLLYKDVNEAYATKYNKTIVDTITAEMSGKNEYAFLLAHYALLDRRQAVAFALYKAFKGMGTDESGLNNLTVLFSSIVNSGVLEQAYSQFGEIQKDIKGDLKGDYEKAILAMWGF
uniref:Annexin 10 n=1 Tax=Spironucleus barkhanus TaxID=103874 RepID=A0A142C662_SPIBA|nr:annexin 10 [Spironucleus barkhanus]